MRSKVIKAVADSEGLLTIEDGFTILALVISTLLMVGRTEALMTFAKRSWEEDGAFIFYTRLAAFIGLFSSGFAAAVHLWLKAASLKEAEYKSKLLAVFASLLIICGGYVGFYFLGNKPGLGIQEAFALWAKSIVAASLWVLGLLACCKSLLEFEKTLSTTTLQILSRIMLFVFYSVCIASYIKLGWTAEASFWTYWIQLLVLIELPVGGAAIVSRFRDYVNDWARSVRRKDMNETIASGIVAVGLGAGIMHFASTISASACETDGGCGFMCVYRLEAALTLLACECLLILAILQTLSWLDIDRLVQRIVSVSVVFVMVMIPIIVHDWHMPQWLERIAKPLNFFGMHTQQ